MNNFERGDIAAKALAAVKYEDPADTMGQTIPTPSGEEAPTPGGYPISDLIADLCHLAQRIGADPIDLVDKGRVHYACDLVEQAFQNDESWDNPLQSGDNVKRAEEILRVNHIPVDDWPLIMVYVGLS